MVRFLPIDPMINGSNPITVTRMDSIKNDPTNFLFLGHASRNKGVGYDILAGVVTGKGRGGS